MVLVTAVRHRGLRIEIYQESYSALTLDRPVISQKTEFYLYRILDLNGMVTDAFTGMTLDKYQGFEDALVCVQEARNNVDAFLIR